MKQLVLLLISLTILTNLSYASFPITENNTCEVLSELDKKSNNDPWYESKLVKILAGIILIIAWPFGLIYLFYLLYTIRKDSIYDWKRALSLLGMMLIVLFLMLVLIGNAIFSGGSFM